VEQLLTVIRDRVDNDAATVWRLNEIAFARRRHATEDERRVLTTLLVVLAEVSQSMRVD
jgi:RNA binding exosome subunit